jgi:hypothetical protein
LKILFWLLFLLSIGACSAENHVLKTDHGNLCIPYKYVVKTSEIGLPPGNYDPEGGGYDISLSFKPEKLAASIEGYQKIPMSPGIPGYQTMYVMLSKSHRSKKIDPIPTHTMPLEESPQLRRLEKDAIAWQVGEKADGGYLLWGHCSDTFDADNRFDCIRDLLINRLKLSYVIHQRNLANYPAIDDFLARKIEAWKCATTHQ